MMNKEIQDLARDVAAQPKVTVDSWVKLAYLGVVALTAISDEIYRLRIVLSGDKPKSTLNRVPQKDKVSDSPSKGGSGWTGLIGRE